jgi:hypothetical protein
MPFRDIGPAAGEDVLPLEHAARPTTPSAMNRHGHFERMLHRIE